VSADQWLKLEVEALRQQNAELRSRLAAIQEDFAVFALPGDELAPLTRTELAIAKILHDRGGACVPKERIHHSLYALRVDDAPDPKIIDVLVCKMRPKLRCWRIETLWGQGYAMRPVDADREVAA